ncbi:MFS transporter [Shewanella avicenniae]|uniref:MFS transporter n=1 Tax=Shewanella avicenniae TaxID=2814294 RepID=A0ABX7QM91_9GAMM|nr:MFS transporter [Shewanella avicenniae]QSX32566.1 MFS transporter [Shewanella avicenniae]
MNMTARRRVRDLRLVWALCIASLVIYINLYMMQGMLPLIAEHFQVTSARSTLVLSVTSFTLALSLLVYAVVSDRVGRHRPIVVSLWALALSNLLLVFIDDFQTLLFVRFLQGGLLASLPAIAMAYFKEQLKPQIMLTAAAVYITANSFGGIVGRLLGGAMSQLFDWQSAMLVCLLFSIVGVGVTHYLLSRTRDAVKREHIRQSWSERLNFKKDIAGFMHHLRDSQMRLAYLIGGITFMMMVNQYSFIQLHLMDAFNWSRFQVTLIFLCYSSGTIASYFTARWISQHGQLPLYRISLAMMLVGSLVTLFDTEVAICIGFLLSSCGFFVTHSCCNSFVALRATTHRAKATSLYLCCYYLGAAAGGPYLMLFWQHSGWAGVITGSMVLLSLIAVFVWRLGYRQRQAMLPHPVC